MNSSIRGASAVSHDERVQACQGGVLVIIILHNEK